MPKKTPSGRNRASSRNRPPRRRLVHSDSGTAVETPTPVASSRLPNRLAAAPPSRLARHETPTARATFDYSYVASDLRRIAIAFGGIVIALIILSFVIH